MLPYEFIKIVSSPFYTHVIYEVIAMVIKINK